MPLRGNGSCTSGHELRIDTYLQPIILELKSKFVILQQNHLPSAHVRPTFMSKSQPLSLCHSRFSTYQIEAGDCLCGLSVKVMVAAPVEQFFFVIKLVEGPSNESENYTVKRMAGIALPWEKNDNWGVESRCFYFGLVLGLPSIS